jgi:hypothetical protein
MSSIRKLSRSCRRASKLREAAAVAAGAAAAAAAVVGGAAAAAAAAAASGGAAAAPAASPGVPAGSANTGRATQRRSVSAERINGSADFFCLGGSPSVLPAQPSRTGGPGRRRCCGRTLTAPAQGDCGPAIVRLKVAADGPATRPFASVRVRQYHCRHFGLILDLCGASPSAYATRGEGCFDLNFSAESLGDLCHAKSEEWCEW